MRALSDKWNPRLWLRDWLNQPSQTERLERAEGERVSRQFFEELSRASLAKATRPGGLISEAIKASAPPTMSGPVNLHAQGTPSAVVGRSGASR